MKLNEIDLDFAVADVEKEKEIHPSILRVYTESLLGENSKSDSWNDGPNLGRKLSNSFPDFPFDPKIRTFFAFLLSLCFKENLCEDHFVPDIRPVRFLLNF